MTQHQGTMEWGPHMDPTPLCLGVVSLLCSMSLRITPRLLKLWMGNFKEIDVILILPSDLQKLEDVYWSPRPNCPKVTRYGRPLFAMGRHGGLIWQLVSTPLLQVQKHDSVTT
jgi:hypothetical protein